MTKYDSYWLGGLSQMEAGGRLRHLRHVERLPMARIRVDQGPELLDFSSNDYLGMSCHPALASGARNYVAQFGAGSGGSRLVTGNLGAFEEIECKLAKGKNMDAALVFVSGVQANLTILPALFDARVLGAEPLVYADRLNHASLIQGCVAAGVRQIRFRHNDLKHLEELLKRDAHQARPRFIITESIFSMDGDCPDLMALSKLAEKYEAFLYIDEAHATGVAGSNGFGLASGLKNTLIMGTFSKGLGGFGAYVACSTSLRDFLINKCGGIIYATALPPAVLGAMNASLDLIPLMGAERSHLHKMAARLRDRLKVAGMSTGKSTTQIVPIIFGEERRTLSMAARLEEEGYYAVAIRPPTVPAGTSRLRLAVSAMHREDEIEALATKIIKFSREYC
ncbi:MAG: 8-amino-7-oxononanoate synthase [Rhodospirillales bacterium]|nr:8-amino-7-oxononanoate synthase [Rhodospirillales bacterium]